MISVKTVSSQSILDESAKRIKLPPDLFNKIRKTIESLVQLHKDSWDNHRNTSTDTGPVIGKSLRLHNIEGGAVYQFNVYYWNRPKKMYAIHGMKELGGVTFFYQTPGYSDGYNLYQGNIITHHNQDSKYVIEDGVRIAAHPRPDLNQETAAQFLYRIEKILEEEKNKGKIL